MRFIAIAFVAALAAIPVSAQQAATAQVETGAAAVPASVAAPAAVPAGVAPAATGAAAPSVAPAARHPAGLEVVQPRFSDASSVDLAMGAQVDTRTRNILAVIGAVVVVLALLSFVR
jgi:hypothetical protein